MTQEKEQMKRTFKRVLVSSLIVSGWVMASLHAIAGEAKSSKFERLLHLDLPHLDLEMTGQDYLQKMVRDGLVATELEPVLQMGKRNLDWLIRINQGRVQKGKATLSFSSAATQQGFPLDAPRIYNASIVEKQYQSLVAELPHEMKRVLIDGAPMTDELPVDEVTYIRVGLSVDRVYQLAARWNLMQPYLSALAARRKMDVRGYYFLSKIEDLKDKLNEFSELPDDEKEKLSAWLIGLCYMQDSQSRCQDALNRASSEDQVWEYYSRYVAKGKKVWDEFFVIPAYRNDVLWSSAKPHVMTVPFVRPEKAEIADFLKVNVEDEFRWKDWSLVLDFSASPSVNTTHIRFEPGTTPHVNRIAGSIITMDANAPLTEYDVQWTIRHEYGHTIGFPDCYLEFYDSDSKEIISYQMDITNLMCSRRGHLQELHYSELKRVYYR